jgi:hypothetical protein
MTKLIVELRFDHRIPDQLRPELACEEGVSEFEEHKLTVRFEVYDSAGIQKRIYDWMQQTCLSEGEVRMIRVSRLDD